MPFVNPTSGPDGTGRVVLDFVGTDATVSLDIATNTDTATAQEIEDAFQALADMIDASAAFTLNSTFVRNVPGADEVTPTP